MRTSVRTEFAIPARRRRPLAPARVASRAGLQESTGRRTSVRELRQELRQPRREFPGPAPGVEAAGRPARVLPVADPRADPFGESSQVAAADAARFDASPARPWPPRRLAPRGTRRFWPRFCLGAIRPWLPRASRCVCRLCCRPKCRAFSFTLRLHSSRAGSSRWVVARSALGRPRCGARSLRCSLL